MNSSSFPVSWPDSDAVTGHDLAPDGIFEPAPGRIGTMPAAAGLWTTAADLVRFGVTWPSLLPGALAREALRPQAARAGVGGHMGLGWILAESGGIAGHAGEGPGASASLIIHVGTNQAHVALTNRQVPVEPVNGRIIRAAAVMAVLARGATPRNPARRSRCAWRRAARQPLWIIFPNGSRGVTRSKVGGGSPGCRWIRGQGFKLTGCVSFDR